ncbi:MAG: TolC family protein [Parabacteroides sp.]|nr:TolC family protein [Parabacteroides sp.]
MKRGYLFTAWILLAFTRLQAATEENTVRLTLEQAIGLAKLQSVDAAIALNELKTAYWEYRTYRADLLPEVNFSGTLPNYRKEYNSYQENNGTYTFVRNNFLDLTGTLSVDQNIWLTGGKISVQSSLDFLRQLGGTELPFRNQYMSIPVSLTLSQPIFGVNHLKWQRRINPVKYQEAKARYMESVEELTITTIRYFFNLVLARENLNTANQNLTTADKLYEIARAKRKIGQLSESELMQLKLSALQAKASVTEAQSNLNANMFQLRAYLGLSEEDYIDPVLPESAPDLQMNYRDVLEKALANNSFAKNIVRWQLEANYEVAKAKGEMRNIELFASVGYTGTNHTLPAAYRNLMDNQVVEIGVKIPLLDWGKRKGKVKVAESNREVILSKTRQEELNFNQNIFLLVENFNNQAAQLTIAEEADAIAEKRYQTAVQTFMIGKIDILDLNDARNSKDEARQKRITELADYWYYFYNIRSLTLFDYERNRELEGEEIGR